MLTNRSPGASSANSVELIAAIPVENAAAVGAPSSAAILASRTATVGLEFRE